MRTDNFTISIMEQTAESMSRLAALRGVTVLVDVNSDGNYIANGHNCGRSVHGFYEWLNKQPGVKP